MYRANATLESERAAFESEKKAHGDLYEKQQAVRTGVDHIALIIPVSIGTGGDAEEPQAAE